MVFYIGEENKTEIFNTGNCFKSNFDISSTAFIYTSINFQKFSLLLTVYKLFA